MSEKAPQTNSSLPSGSELSRKAYLDYPTGGLQIDAKHNRHPQAQAKVEEVFGSKEGEGRLKDAVLFGGESTANNIKNSYIHRGTSYGFDDANLLPALRSGDIERQFHNERLDAVMCAIGATALDAKKGTRWERFKGTLAGVNDDLTPVMLDREMEFSTSRLSVLPTEEESKKWASDFYARHEDAIRADAQREDTDRKIAAIQAAEEAADTQSDDTEE